jgi:flagellar protein FliS
MYSDAKDAYLESRVLSASPMELVQMMNGAAIAAVRDARRHLAAGDIAARSRSVTKACEIVIELAASLDLKRGGQVAVELSRLYDFLLGRLMDGNATQTDGPLAEALSVLTTLGEAWEEIVPKPAVETQTVNVWNAMPPQVAAAEASHAWSF